MPEKARAPYEVDAPGVQTINAVRVPPFPAPQHEPSETGAFLFTVIVL